MRTVAVPAPAPAASAGSTGSVAARSWAARLSPADIAASRPPPPRRRARRVSAVVRTRRPARLGVGLGLDGLRGSTCSVWPTSAVVGVAGLVAPDQLLVLHGPEADEDDAAEDADEHGDEDRRTDGRADAPLRRLGAGDQEPEQAEDDDADEVAPPTVAKKLRSSGSWVHSRSCVSSGHGRSVASLLRPHGPRPPLRSPSVRITAKVDYAVRAMCELAGQGGGPVRGERLAAAQAIPQSFLENILHELKRAGLVATQRGVDGGYRLGQAGSRDHRGRHHPRRRGPSGRRARAPGPTAWPTTVRAPASLRDVWLAVRANLRAVLELVTVADIAEDHLPDLVPLLLADPEALRPH